eukprot:PhM_4_TR17071/c0_g1_i1/m.87209
MSESDSATQMSTASGSSHHRRNATYVHCQLCIDDLIISGDDLKSGDDVMYKCEWRLTARKKAASGQPDPLGADDKNNNNNNNQQTPPLEGSGSTRGVTLNVEEGVLLWREFFDMSCVEMGIPPIDVLNRRFLDFTLVRLEGPKSKRTELGKVKVAIEFDDTKKRKRAELKFMTQETDMRCELKIAIKMEENPTMKARLIPAPAAYVRGAERAGAAAFKPKERTLDGVSSDGTTKKNKTSAGGKDEDDAAKPLDPMTNHSSRRAALPGEKRCHRCGFYFRPEENTSNACCAHIGILEHDNSILARNVMVMAAGGILIGAASGGIATLLFGAKTMSGTATLAKMWTTGKASSASESLGTVMFGAEVGGLAGVCAGLATAVPSTPGPYTTTRYACCGTFDEKCPNTAEHSEW